MYEDARLIFNDFNQKKKNKINEEDGLTIQNCFMNYAKLLFLLEEYKEANKIVDLKNNLKGFQPKLYFVEFKIKSKLMKDFKKIIELIDETIEKLKEDQKTKNSLNNATTSVIQDLIFEKKKYQKLKNKEDEEIQKLIRYNPTNESKNEFEWKQRAYKKFKESQNK